MPDVKTGWVLAGATAAGKTAVAHQWAVKQHLPVLSADSMLVYRGMDIGTAKPNDAEQAECSYYGIDLAEPSARYSCGQYMDYAVGLGDALDEVVITGGTGLYIKSLLQGLDAVAPADPTWRAEAEELLAAGGLERLLETVRQRWPEALKLVTDLQNPRRIIRAVERARGAREEQSAWQQVPQQRIPGLLWDRAQLSVRIRQRVELMYQQGLLDEAARLLDDVDALSETAAKAIGYQEAFAVLAGGMSLGEAKERTVIRTRQLAKRQQTWLRNQLDVEWIAVSRDMSVEQIVDEVQAVWQQTGPVRLYGLERATKHGK